MVSVPSFMPNGVCKGGSRASLLPTATGTDAPLTRTCLPTLGNWEITRRLRVMRWVARGVLRPSAAAGLEGLPRRLLYYLVSHLRAAHVPPRILSYLARLRYTFRCQEVDPGP